MNKVYALVGPPASGKSSIAKQLVKYGVPEMVSHTTRKPKPGEQDGITYYFVSNEEFNKIDLVERVSYSGHSYGLSKTEVQSKISKYQVSIVVVDRHGLEQLKKLLGERINSIYIMADEATIIDRIIAQGDDPTSMRERIEYAKSTGEFNNWQIADYVVKNTDSLDVAVRQAMAIMGLTPPAVHLS